MFAYIKGSLEIKLDDSVVIETGGVGYKIFMAKNVIDKIREFRRYSKDTYTLSCKGR